MGRTGKTSRTSKTSKTSKTSRTSRTGKLEKLDKEQQARNPRMGHSREIVDRVKEYLRDLPANCEGQAESLLDMIYQAYTEFSSGEPPEFRALVKPMDEVLLSLADTVEEADKYMGIVFGLCAAYGRQGYIEGMKAGARLMVELMEWEMETGQSQG